MFLGGCAAPPTPSVKLSDNGTWTWFNDPRAVYDAHTDRVYTGWITNTGTVQFAAHDLKTGRTTVCDLKRGFEADDHNNPALLLHNNGSLSAFYTAHRTEYPERAVLWRAITPHADGSYRLGVEQTIYRDDDVHGEKKNTYANPFHLTNDQGNARTYLFSRGENFNPVYRIREDDADANSWSASRNVILNAPNRPYVKYDSNGVDRISFLFTDGNPGSAKNNIYYMYLQDGVLHNADGSAIRKLVDGPIAPADAGKVFDHTANPSLTGDSSWVWDVATDRRTGLPVATFVSLVSGTRHLYHYASFDGKQWHDHMFNFEPGGGIEGSGSGIYSAGVVLDHTDPAIVYLSRKMDSRYVLEQWKTPDGGTTWSSKRIVTEKHDKIIRPYVPLYRPADREMVLWLSGEYDSWDASKGDGFHTSVHLWTNPTSSPMISTK